MMKTVPAGALAGVRVIDASRVLGGPYCGQILGDHGADVLKIEVAHGDDTRQWGPPFMGPNSAYFSGANRNKQTHILDLSTPQGREALFEMLDTADVFVENFKRSTLEKWGLTLESFRSRNPRLIHCRVSGFGSVGPYGDLPAYDPAVQALSGIMSVNGNEQSGPLRVGLPVVDLTTGMSAVIGVLLALYERTLSGVGQLVETTLYGNALAMLHPHTSNYFSNGKNPVRTGNAHPNIYPYDCFETAEGLIYLAVGNDVQFKIFCAHVGLEPLVNDERFATSTQRHINRDALKEILVQHLRTYHAKTLATELIHKGVPCAPVQSVEEVLSDPHTKAQNLIVELEPGYRGIASPIMMSRTPPSYRYAPPTLPETKDTSDD